MYIRRCLFIVQAKVVERGSVSVHNLQPIEHATVGYFGGWYPIHGLIPVAEQNLSSLIHRAQGTGFVIKNNW